jgi:hypothetical protein
MTASELLTPSNPEETEDVREAIEASIKVFVAQNATELPSSRLIEYLEQQEGIKISAKRFKKLMQSRGIHLVKKKDANYYCKDDFIIALSSIPP